MPSSGARSLAVDEAYLKFAQNALAEKGLTQTALAKAAGMSRTTIVKFLSARSIDRHNFVRICGELDLDWQEAAGLNNASQAMPGNSVMGNALEKNVQDLRQRVAPHIQQRCGVMRVLDMTHPIDSTAIYTDVNILERVTSKSRADLEQLMQGVDAENFDRFCLGHVREARVPGLEALARHRLLMILGKPGAGKTTFLKRLAMWCKAGKQGLAGRVPIFVTLKEFADDRRKPETLIEFVLESYGLTESAADLEALLKAGRALVLLDGLDEVRNSEHDRVLAAIREFGRKYGPKGQSLEDWQAQDDQNQIVITCRIAAREYIFERFTEVEMADFQDEQIQDFANKWFLAHEPDKLDEDGASKVGRLFGQELEQSQPVKELATNPLLLTLLCLEFGEDCGFPSSRAELYERGLEILFTKWDGSRQIKRDQIYKKLPVKRKKDLLAQLAWTTFERGDYFFKQAVAEQQIQQYIQNLPGASEDEEALLLDSAAVLRSIEAQHGLLTQRAVGIYSFSHLTFQEYFSAACLVERPEFQERLLEGMHKQRWREVCFLVTEKLGNADDFLLKMQGKNDSFIKRNKSVIRFLETQSLKDELGGLSDKLYEVRALWGSQALARARDLTSDRARDLISGHARARARDRARDLTSARALARARTLALDSTSALALASDLALDLALDLDLDLDLDLGEVIRAAIDKASQDEFKQSLKLLQQDIQSVESLGRNDDAYWKWWKKYGSRWIKQFREALITHRNIGHRWELTTEELKLLECYYYGSKLLIDCLNSECYVSREVRQQIEDNLLIPPD